jgi:hypothetical protein
MLWRSCDVTLISGKLMAQRQFMKEPPDDIELRLLFILHRGLVEARLLAGANKSKQVSDLADALELIPGMLKDWHDDDLDQVRLLLKTYQDKYPVDGFNFFARLGDRDPLPF